MLSLLFPSSNALNTSVLIFLYFFNFLVLSALDIGFTSISSIAPPFNDDRTLLRSVNFSSFSLAVSTASLINLSWSASVIFPSLKSLFAFITIAPLRFFIRFNMSWSFPCDVAVLDALTLFCSFCFSFTSFTLSVFFSLSLLISPFFFLHSADAFDIASLYDLMLFFFW